MFNEKFHTVIDGCGQFSVLFKFQQLQPFLWEVSRYPTTWILGYHPTPS